MSVGGSQLDVDAVSGDAVARAERPQRTGEEEVPGSHPRVVREEILRTDRAVAVRVDPSRSTRHGRRRAPSRRRDATHALSISGRGQG